jgi:hypothetical protein
VPGLTLFEDGDNVIVAREQSNALPFMTSWREARFDRAANIMTIRSGSKWLGQREKQVPFKAVVEVRASYHPRQTGAGWHLAVQLENWQTFELNATPAIESVALSWIERLSTFITGRPPSTLEAFSLPR